MPSKSCFTCGYRSLDATKCPLIGFQYTDDRNHVCPYWTGDLIKCSRCGKILVSPNVIYSQSPDGTWKAMCNDCVSLFGTCGGCTKSYYCDFESNPSPIPKAVEKRIQQGPQIIITQIPNPERIDMTCRKNCECFSEEFGCMRNLNTCHKYEEIE